jgi:hypothetical protein
MTARKESINVDDTVSVLQFCFVSRVFGGVFVDQSGKFAMMIEFVAISVAIKASSPLQTSSNFLGLANFI